jgi:hypothetical protein
MNLTISLDERLAAQLQQEASARRLSPEQVAQGLLGSALSKIAEVAAWLRAHQRRAELIRKRRDLGLTPEERAEFEQLQAAVDQWPAPFDPVVLNRRFHENRKNFPEEQLAAYAGQLVAWWPDGSRIFDADADYHALFRRVEAAGYPSSFFPFEPIPRPDQTEIDPYIALAMRFNENRDSFPAEELAKYAGKTVAWWLDGSKIVDADIDSEALVHRLRQNGYDPSYIRMEYIRLPDESFV